MSYHDRPWRNGVSAKGQLNWREGLRNRPDHLVTVDNHGVYNERRRLQSKYYGVRWRQKRNRTTGEWQRGFWHVSFILNGEFQYGGEFKEEFEVRAAMAYDDLVRQTGANKPLNFPSDN
jgi:hypothetical protein